MEEIRDRNLATVLEQLYAEISLLKNYFGGGL